MTLDPTSSVIFAVHERAQRRADGERLPERQRPLRARQVPPVRHRAHPQARGHNSIEKFQGWGRYF